MAASNPVRALAYLRDQYVPRSTFDVASYLEVSMPLARMILRRLAKRGQVENLTERPHMGFWVAL